MFASVTPCRIRESSSSACNPCHNFRQRARPCRKPRRPGPCVKPPPATRCRKLPTCELRVGSPATCDPVS